MRVRFSPPAPFGIYMKITKYEHACLVIEDNGKVLVLDPGAFDKTFDGDVKCDVLVITHEHFDHFNEDKVERLLSLNPDLEVITTEHVAGSLSAKNRTIVKDGDSLDVGGFNLQIYGVKHAFIHDLAPPVCDNFGVLINNRVYYPGDSFDKPGGVVEILAVPTSGPWLKTGEAMQMILDIKPSKAFPTHNALNSTEGNDVQMTYLRKTADVTGTEMFEIEDGETVEI